jgi:hypothetical protein
MKRSYTYDIKIPPSLNLRESLIINKIIDTLNDPQGWAKFGYHFYYNPNKKTDFIIKIVPNKTIKKICKFDGLSCCDLSTNIIYLNLENWKKGSKKSKLSLDEYRCYQITHECGHIIGKGHLKIEDFKPGTKAPVMIQQTLGIGNLKPNCYPTIYDFYA